MSANRDNTQKTAFVYSNLYQLYRKNKETSAQDSQSEALKSFFQLPGHMPSESNVLKTVNLKQESAPRVTEYNPPSFIGPQRELKNVVKPVAVAQPQAQAVSPHAQQTSAVQSLKENLKSLNELHSRLRFMLQELEELVKE